MYDNFNLFLLNNQHLIGHRFPYLSDTYKLHPNCIDAMDSAITIYIYFWQRCKLNRFLSTMSYCRSTLLLINVTCFSYISRTTIFYAHKNDVFLTVAF